MAAVKESSIVTSSRREAIVAFIIWACATAYSSGYCAWKGYNRSAEDLTFVLGFPDWVFWGVMVPWTACTIVSWWFAFVYMTDEDLEEPAAAPTGDSESEGVEHV